MNWKTVSISAVISIVLITGAFFIYTHKFKDKTGYVKTGYIINEYKGMVLANEQFNREMKQVQVNMDTLRLRYERLQAAEKNAAPAIREEQAYRLGMARAEYEKYNQQAGEQMEARKRELSGKVLEEINNFVQDYGKKNGYRYILGTTENGSILYATEADDLTNTILQALNEKHSKTNPASSNEEQQKKK